MGHSTVQRFFRIIGASALLLALALHAEPLSAEKPSQEAGQKASEAKNIPLEEFDKLRQQSGVVVLDVRTPREFRRGRIPGAVHLDWYRRDFADRVAELDKDKTYLVYCAVGGRSAEAGKKMKELGFKKVYNFVGGYKAWESAEKPVIK
jgi:rhodanese-related sulfurtransferase